eukprot:CAMPEP_0204303958 /NCGR_PEP_ID=MMETSP0468-20130131/84170_1 /ASSEMBLY_ACC=CAM_ASM_000383 /TAXON_ID=2969 /ORGANISM="Oxyrrhis marina" /LENGTH=45 /DNA_ID= /DNA_START= /DNA_END= /DNA_ORIENTATION=
MTFWLFGCETHGDTYDFGTAGRMVTTITRHDERKDLAPKLASYLL